MSISSEKPNTSISQYLAHSSSDPERIPHQTLLDHATQVAKLAEANAAHFNQAALARAAGLLHDLGKYSIPFQERLMGAAKRVDHSTWGAKLAIERYGKNLGALLAYCIAGHHAGLANGSGYDGERTALTQRLADPDLPKLEPIWQEELELPPQGALMAELKKLNFYEHCKPFSLTFLTRMIFSALVDADFLDTERYYDQFQPEDEQRHDSRSRTMPSLAELRAALDAYLATFTAQSEVNTIRAEILSYARQQATSAPGLFSLNVPTGGGKTLTSLAFALDHAIKHGQRRVIFVIPFTSIVEQNAAVFRKALGPLGEHAVLEHHSAFSAPRPDKGDPDRFQSQQKLRLAMENWDAPVVVTTAVQFFESLFAARPSQCRKLHNIANSVIILDEVQTLPLKLLKPSVAAIHELASNYRSSVVLCTATQPALEAPKFVGGLQNVRPLVADAAVLAKRLERVHVRHVGELNDEALCEHLKKHRQVLCIVNNRLHARAVHRALEELPGTVHLSTLMCARHRSQVLDQVRERLKHQEDCRVISTSLIEAGVDVSFPTVMRAEAGLDSIAQAAGRCNRNKEWAVKDSEVLVFSNANPDWAPPPDLLQFAQAAREVLRQHQQEPLAPDAIQAYFELLYWQKGDKELDAKAILSLLNQSTIDRLPMETMARNFRMIDSHQQTVIIGWDDTARRALQALRFADKAGGLARALQPYTVQVPRKAFDELYKSGAIQPVAPEKWADQFIELVNMDLYSDSCGLGWENPAFMEAANTVI